MIDDTLAHQLHDKATRGGALTEIEQANLDEWYQQKDAEEGSLLSSSNAQTSAILRNLQAEVEASAERLLTVTQHIQSLTNENEELRRDIAALHQQLIHAPRQAA